MTSIQRLSDVLRSGLLEPALTQVASNGASHAQIEAFEHAANRTLSAAHRTILLTWNGLDLDVLRLAGIPPVESGLTSLHDLANIAPLLADDLPFGSDPCGFIYFERQDLSVWSWDHDGGSLKPLGSDIDDFICRIVFGSGAAAFGGSDWLDDLHRHGVL